MTGPVEPIARTILLRRAPRAQHDADSSQNGDTSEDGAAAGDDEDRPPPPRQDAFAAFAAHLMGQTGQKRGLRGGPQVLDAARSTYLGTEYSGLRDRRPRAGLIKKTDI
ncbi:MAG: hypothetical protein JWP92_2472 [Caulobacter sp.]|nr:hypothetical protein [Caulobacter sp.]